MARNRKHNILKDSKIAVGIVAAVLLVLGLILVAQGFIDTRNYRDEIVQAIKEKTGREVTIKGAVTVALLPTPTIYVADVELRDADSEHPAPAITVEMVRLGVPVGDVFAQRPRISGITLQNPVLEVTRTQDHLIRWDWLNAGLLKSLAGGDGDAVSLSIAGGKIIYRDEQSDKGMTLENLSASGTAGRRLSLSGSFAAYGRSLKFAVTADSAAADGSTPFSAKLYTDDKNTLAWQGSADLTAAPPVVKAAMTLDVEDVSAWLQVKAQEEETPVLEQMTGGFSGKKPAAKKEALPLSVTGDWAQQGGNITLGNLKLTGLNSEGSGNMALTWADGQPDIAVDMKFSALDYAPWKTLADRALQARLPEGEDIYAARADTDNPLPRDLRLNLAVSADKVAFGAQAWQNANLSLSLADAAITVNQFTVTMPGESKLALFGIVSQGSTGGLRFEGSVETEGKSLRQILTVADASAAGLPEMGSGDFYVRSNIFISPEQMRLSEADVKISDLHLNGGMVAYFDANPRIEADIKLKDIDFDYFRDKWRERRKSAGPQESAAVFKRSMNFDWLRKLHTTVDFKLSVEGFTFLERHGTNASLRIFGKESEFGIYDARFNYPGQVTEGSFTLNMKDDQPFINLVLNTPEIDTAYFSALPDPADKDKAAAADAGKKIWPEELIDMSWMEGWNGAFDVTAGRLVHGGMALDRLRLQAKLQDHLLTFQNLTFVDWQGQCGVTGSLYGGEVPGLSLGITLYNAELHDMLKEAAGYDNITGRISLSGTLAASGINILSWVSQSEAKLTLAARGVNVTGLNLQGVVDAVAVSRVAADVFNNVNRVVEDGSTLFDVDGVINVKGGVMRTPGIALKADATLGDLTGEVRLVPWTMDVSTLFQFPAMPSETIPTMTVQLTGPINAPQLKTDTASLEAYVAKRITGK